MSAPKAPRSEAVDFSSCISSKLRRTTSGVSASPSWKRTPSRRRRVHVVGPSLRQDSASSPRISPFGP